jgi:hypothetical protein
MPRPRPQQGLRATAALADAVPLPRTRPGEETAAPAQQTRPAFDRHGAE